MAIYNERVIKLGYMCIKAGKECDGCMDCRPSPHYHCPICNKEVSDTVFVDNSGEVIGCENCVETKEPHEVLSNETD